MAITIRKFSANSVALTIHGVYHKTGKEGRKIMSGYCSIGLL
jgi:hypothetical protein